MGIRKMNTILNTLVVRAVFACWCVPRAVKPHSMSVESGDSPRGHCVWFHLTHLLVACTRQLFWVRVFFLGETAANTGIQLPAVHPA